MKGVVAVLLIVVGLLMAGLSGLCTATFALSALASLAGPNGASGAPLLIIALVIGAPFIAGGVGLILGGRALMRRPKPPGADVF